MLTKREIGTLRWRMVYYTSIDLRTGVRVRRLAFIPRK